VFQYKEDDDDEDDYADQNFNPGIRILFILLCIERKSRGSSYFAKGGG
jgi:hypothetical protein